LIYADLEPGYAVGEHKDSAEEAILVVEGTLEVMVGSESCVLLPGEMIVIPAQTWHNPRNIGLNRAQFIGFFASPEIESEFKHAIHPDNM
jgi:mannose-6-phosphate isomerase-like protein (cupin superfamily)